MEKKYCLECRHFEFSPGFGGSDVTPSEDASMECRKGHWKVKMYRDDEQNLREYFAKANDCEDFELDLTLPWKPFPWKEVEGGADEGSL
jgi:hypothetical protein